jgi:hypothetical protein
MTHLRNTPLNKPMPQEELATEPDTNTSAHRASPINAIRSKIRDEECEPIYVTFRASGRPAR